MKRQVALRKAEEVCQRLHDSHTSLPVRALELHIFGSVLTAKPSPQDVDLLFKYQEHPITEAEASHWLYIFTYKPHLLPSAQTLKQLRHGMQMVRLHPLEVGAKDDPAEVTAQDWLNDRFPADTPIRLLWTPAISRDTTMQTLAAIEHEPLSWDPQHEVWRKFVNRRSQDIVRRLGEEAARTWIAGLRDTPADQWTVVMAAEAAMAERELAAHRDGNFYCHVCGQLHAPEPRHQPDSALERCVGRVQAALSTYTGVETYPLPELLIPPDRWPAHVSEELGEQLDDVFSEVNYRLAWAADDLRKPRGARFAPFKMDLDTWLQQGLPDAPAIIARWQSKAGRVEQERQEWLRVCRDLEQDIPRWNAQLTAALSASPVPPKGGQEKRPREGTPCA